MLPHPTDLLEAYALRLLSPELEQEVAHHLAECATCRAEVADQEDAFALMAYAAAPRTPPPDLEERVIARVQQARRETKGMVQVAEPPVTARTVTMPARVAPRAVPQRRAPVWVSAMGAVAAVAILAFVGLHLNASGSQPPSYRAQLAAQARTALHAPNASIQYLTATNNGPQDAVAVLATDPATDRGVVVVGHMPALDGGHVYEFWLVHDANGTVSATPEGAISVAASGTGELELPSVQAAHLENAGISVEVAGQPITQPDSPMVMLLRV